MRCSEVGEVSVIEDLRMLAMSRIYLDNIPHVKAYWVMYGKATTELRSPSGPTTSTVRSTIRRKSTPWRGPTTGVPA